ncbi:MAG: sulfotransferase domain-containing protein [Pseudomonadales bacterium]|jgi:aryl sulfotransferase
MKSYKTAVFDNDRWNGFEARSDDIFVCTPPKCGTTWTQTIVVSLLFPDGPPGPVMELSPWMEARFNGPIENVHARLASQTHRRVIKSHTAADGIPWFDDCRYLFVCRDGRDVFMSMANHIERMKHLDAMNEEALKDGVPPLPGFDGDLHSFFDQWLERDDAYFPIVASYWAKKDLPNLMLVHYNDLKKDLDGEMKRIARFLDIEVPEEKWAAVADRCTFERMREDESIVGDMSGGFEGGTKGFIFKGTNGRWRSELTAEELARYDRRLRDSLPADAVAWTTHGGHL